MVEILAEAVATVVLELSDVFVAVFIHVRLQALLWGQVLFYSFSCSKKKNNRLDVINK